jgi:hypothetical protein
MTKNLGFNKKTYELKFYNKNLWIIKKNGIVTSTFNKSHWEIIEDNHFIILVEKKLEEYS